MTIKGQALLPACVLPPSRLDSKLLEVAVETASTMGALTVLLMPLIRTPTSAQLLALLLHDIVTDELCPGSADDGSLLALASAVCPLPGVRSCGATKSTTRSFAVVSGTLTLGVPLAPVAVVPTGSTIATFEKLCAMAALPSVQVHLHLTPCGRRTVG
jgi:hypothetical protein